MLERGHGEGRFREFTPDSLLKGFDRISQEWECPLAGGLAVGHSREEDLPGGDFPDSTSSRHPMQVVFAPSFPRPEFAAAIPAFLHHKIGTKPPESARFFRNGALASSSRSRPKARAGRIFRGVFSIAARGHPRREAPGFAPAARLPGR